jgi:RNA recognition motif-containing protein
MEHLMTANGDGPPISMDQMSSAYPKNSNTAPGLNDIYIGQIPMDVEAPQLYQFFSQFGIVERIFDGRKSSSGGLKWAFVSYYRSEDANKYISTQFHL